MGAHREEIRAQLQESCRVKQSFPEDLLTRIEEFAVKAAAALGEGGKLVFFGNGGSAADAQHMAAELVDRKSTRLNASHVKISYAIFCLKKKKKKSKQCIF